MALFRASTVPWVTAVQMIAESAGASADTEMTTRAHRSLRAAFQHFGGRYRWDFLRGEANPISVIAPFSVTGVSASAGQSSAAAPAGHGFLVNDYLVGSGFVLGTRVSATAASGFGFSAAMTGLAAGVQVITATGTRDFYDAPSDWRHGYSVRLLQAQKSLRYYTSRAYGRSVADEYGSSSPEGYDLFYVGGIGKIRLLPPPSSADTLLIRYYRSFTIASASSITSNLDIPEDYESYLIAWAKWHFLSDKQEGRHEQATTWIALANEGLKTMLAEQTNQQDQDLGFIPGAAWLDAGMSDRSTRYIDWDT